MGGRLSYKVTEQIVGRPQEPPEYLCWVVRLLTICMGLKIKPVQQ